MKRFSSEFIEQVRQANDIVSVISDYVSLNRRGRNFWACCPFHNEKTASFSVTADKGFFYCFGCHAHGDVFQFIMKKKTFPLQTPSSDWPNGPILPCPSSNGRLKK